MSRITRKQILKAIGSDKLKLWNNDYYWWFQFDDAATKRYDTHAVPVMRLSQLSLEQWVAEGQELLAKMEQLQTDLNNLK